jgi:hypothetical protein
MVARATAWVIPDGQRQDVQNTISGLKQILNHLAVKGDPNSFFERLAEKTRPPSTLQGKGRRHRRVLSGLV